MGALDSVMQRLSAEAARGDMPVDEAVYAEAGRPVTDPVLLGSGSLSSRVGIFGRDPGRQEIHLGEPFIGAGGRLVRDVLHERRFGGKAPDVDAARRAGQSLFWGNTVPFKPLGNKAWSMKVKRRFSPLIAEVLVHHWQGDQLITLGNVAFDWFRIEDRSVQPALRAHWALPDRYERSVTISFLGKPITLHPLPHPSPLNARWYPRFPALLHARLEALGWPS